MPPKVTPRRSSILLAAALFLALASPAAGVPILHPGSGEGGGPDAAPQTLITFGPAFRTHLSKPVFRFTDVAEQPGTKFRCKVDDGGWRHCHSPLKLELRAGAHELQVQAVSAKGVADPRPARHRFRVVR